MDIQIILSESVKESPYLAMVKQETIQFSELRKLYKKVYIMVATEKEIGKQFFEEEQLKLFGSKSIQLSEENYSISISGMPPTGCIMINHDKFILLSEWKQKFAIRTMCIRLANLRTPSKNLTGLLSKYQIAYLCDMISYQRQYVSDIYMLKHYPSDWLREPKRIPETAQDPITFYDKVKNEHGIKAAIEVAISNSVRILYLIFIYEYIDDNIKGALDSKKEIDRYRKYLVAWSNCVQKDIDDRVPMIGNLVQKGDFEDEEKLFGKIGSALNSLDLIFQKTNVIGNRWNPQKSDLVQAIIETEKLFDKSWLERQLSLQYSKPKQVHKFSHHLRPEPHPILWLYKKSIENLRNLEENPNSGYGRESLELISFSEMVNDLRQITIVDVDGKPVLMESYDKLRKRLLLSEEFKQALYEIQIATALRKSGLVVFFVLEDSKGKKTPDLLIKEEGVPVFVECKYRLKTDKEQVYDNAFNEFYYKIMRVMLRLGKFYSVCVEWLKDPTSGLIGTEVTRIEKADYKDQILETDNARIWLRKTGLIDQVFEGSFNIDIGPYKSDDLHTDIIMQHADVGIFDGKIKYKNPAFVMFRNISFLDGIVESVVRLLDKAYTQIPNQGPGVVFIETHLPLGKTTTKAPLETLKRKMEGKLNIIGRVNSIFLTNTVFIQRNIKVNERDATVIAKTVESTVIENRHPTAKLPINAAKKIREIRYS